MRRFPYAAAFAVAAMCVGACKSSSTTTAPTTPTSGGPTILTFSSIGALTMNVGDSRQLKVVALLSDGTTEIITNGAAWTASDPSLLTVDGTGIVTAVGAGNGSIQVVSGGVTGTVTVTVNAATPTSQEFIATLAGPSAFSATADLFASPTARSSGTVYAGLASVSATGRFDTAANVLNVVAGGYTLLGTVNGVVMTGTVTDASGNVGAFSGINGSHVAVTTYCGTYTGSDGTTGPFNLAVSLNGDAAASAASLSGAIAATTFTGRVSGSSFTLASSGGATASGSVLSGVVTGSTQASGVTGSFTANSNACR